MGTFLFTLIILFIAFGLISWLWDFYKGSIYVSQDPMSEQSDRENAAGCAPLALAAIIIIAILALILIF